MELTLAGMVLTVVFGMVLGGAAAPKRNLTGLTYSGGGFDYLYAASLS